MMDTPPRDNPEQPAIVSTPPGLVVATIIVLGSAASHRLENFIQAKQQFW
jgi:hypothetical protein